ncbi:hypothetical protein DAPPUDRAFT_258867 [Daphnia pulex]|uniref:Uncharacterized protein n=1 Tax=Daphnia pulex TaxID=6669 RepID=E9HG64_DAPPU|nr:hypothetical protein DAPPUDRAFT_258867 [Daphnia pulex]|eukprot:EFX69279.1 hypothetical protein DAPPUDRAFT_258867 [Daphnia pulex]
MAEEAVNAYNSSHPNCPPISITQELLRTLSTKFWDKESQARSSSKAIHEMERVNIDRLTVPHVDSILKSNGEKGKLMEFEREKFANSSNAASSQQTGKKEN